MASQLLPIGALAVVLLAVVLLLAQKRSRAAHAAKETYAPPPAPGPDAESAQLVDEPEETRWGALPTIPTQADDEEVGDGAPEIEVDEESTESTAPHALILVSAIARTDPGVVRKKNEDAILALDDENLFAVADGVGGQAGGELGSRIAVDTVARCFRERDFAGRRRLTRYLRANELAHALELANTAVRKAAAENPQYAEMGTTFCAARFSPGRRRVYLAHVGDSRAYRVRGGEIVQLTRDHTLANEAGVKGRMGSQLSRAIGMQSRARPEVNVADAYPDDFYLLCSDGLTKMLSDEEIRATVLAHDDLEAAAQRLIAFANEKGGRDNVSVVLIRVDRVSLPRALPRASTDRHPGSTC